MRFDFCLVPVWLLMTAGLAHATDLAHAAPSSLSPGPPATQAAHQSPCRMVRALDGRAVCAQITHQLAVKSRPAQPARKILIPSSAVRSNARYLVIGSFTTRANAEAWAGRNREFSPEIIRTEEGHRPSYRVVVGPLDGETAPLMRAILSAAGVNQTWFADLCDGSTVISGRCLKFPSDASIATLWPARTN